MVFKVKIHRPPSCPTDTTPLADAPEVPHSSPHLASPAQLPEAPLTPPPPLSPPPEPAVPTVGGAQRDEGGASVVDAPVVTLLPSASGVEVIVAPASVQHRFVRGHDLSTIVERPERIRAALLGVCAASARLATANAREPKEEQTYEHGLESHASVPGTLHLHSGPILAPSAVPLFQSTRQLALDPPDPAVALVHAHENEPIIYLGTPYSRREGAQVSLPSQGEGQYALYLQRLCRAAPSAPIPLPETKRNPTSPAIERDIRGPSHSFATSGSASTSDSGSDFDHGMSHLSEIPDSMHQGDLYLCGPTATAAALQESLRADLGGSGEAIRASLGACVSGVDRVVSNRSRVPVPAASLTTVGPGGGTHAVPPPAPRALVLVRPPGHHCAGNVPQGFCWVNNAVVAATHAYLEHGIDRVAILDIDLHHGNGTQALVWRINADTVQHDLKRQALLQQVEQARKQAARHRRTAAAGPAFPAEPIPPRGLKISYGSLHDIESYPCEQGDAEMIMAASTCIEGAHGQWIWNVHLAQYDTPEMFHEHYRLRYAVLFDKARRFFEAEDADPSRSLVLISCGFDACQHEYPGMQRHGKSVPVGFYHQFASDASALADEVAEGKVVSIMEGGYADRAIASGAFAHTLGLAEPARTSLSDKDLQRWWDVQHLASLERTVSKGVVTLDRPKGKGGGRGKKPPVQAAESPEKQHAWLAAVLATFRVWMDALSGQAPVVEARHQRGGPRPSVAPSTRVLRDRTKDAMPAAPATSPPVADGARVAAEAETEAAAALARQLGNMSIQPSASPHAEPGPRLPM